MATTATHDQAISFAILIYGRVVSFCIDRQMWNNERVRLVIITLTKLIKEVVPGRWTVMATIYSHYSRRGWSKSSCLFPLYNSLSLSLFEMDKQFLCLIWRGRISRILDCFFFSQNGKTSKICYHTIRQITLRLCYIVFFNLFKIAWKTDLEAGARLGQVEVEPSRIGLYTVQ